MRLTVVKRTYLPALSALAVAAVLVLASAPSVADAPEAGSAEHAAIDKAVADVQAFYDKSATYKSDFLQKFWVKAYNQEKTSRGHVTFAKPGQVDFSYDDPKGNRVVTDGKVIRVYQAESRQLYEQAVDKSQYPAALSFLTGQGKLGETFEFE